MDEWMNGFMNVWMVGWMVEEVVRAGVLSLCTR